jgi:hypothetical protein
MSLILSCSLTTLTAIYFPAPTPLYRIDTAWVFLTQYGSAQAQNKPPFPEIRLHWSPDWQSGCSGVSGRAAYIPMRPHHTNHFPTIACYLPVLQAISSSAVCLRQGKLRCIFVIMTPTTNERR